jgi:hypothetical protein
MQGIALAERREYAFRNEDVGANRFRARSVVTVWKWREARQLLAMCRGGNIHPSAKFSRYRGRNLAI